MSDGGCDCRIGCVCSEILAKRTIHEATADASGISYFSRPIACTHTQEALTIPGSRSTMPTAPSTRPRRIRVLILPARSSGINGNLAARDQNVVSSRGGIGELDELVYLSPRVSENGSGSAENCELDPLRTHNRYVCPVQSFQLLKSKGSKVPSTVTNQGTCET